MTEQSVPSPTTPTPSTATSPRGRRPWRSPWLLPAGVAAAVGAAVVAPPLLASAGDENLPDVTAEELVQAVATAEPQALDGTVVYTARLGLPELPVSETTGADPLALLGGSSTLRVWTDAQDRSRVALLGAASEYSVVTDGPEAWTYSSSDDEVVHYRLDAAGAARYAELEGQARAGAAPEPLADLPTPEEAARAALAHVEEYSTVSLDAPTTVAGRPAHQLVVTPRTDATLVARVVVAVDAETSTPLRVQTWSTQDPQTPALEVGFTDVTFAEPDEAVLAFSAPAGATVREVVVPLPEPADPAALEELAGAGLTEPGTPPDPAMLPEGVTVTGTGWATVTEVAGVDVQALLLGDPAAVGTLPGSERIIGSERAQDLVGEFTAGEGSPPGDFDLDVSALYEQLTTEVPEGRLLTTALLSALVTPDGRVLVGAVPAETLRGMA